MKQFPYESIQGAARRFADTYCQYIESPWEFLAMGYLTVLGSLIGSQVTIPSAIHPQPRLYTVLVGTSGDTRKSEAIKQVENFFRNALECIKLPYTLTTSGGQGSAEGLARNLKASRNLLLTYDELKAFVSKCLIESSVLLPCVCSLFNKNEYYNATKNRVVDIKEAHLSLLAGCTDDTYRKMWTSAFTDIGFINRLFIVPGFGQKKYSIPDEIPNTINQELVGDLHQILSIVHNQFKEKGKLKLTVKSTARAMYDRWYLEQNSTDYTKRIEDYGLRLLMLLSLNECEEEIYGRIVNQATALLNWQIEVREAYAPNEAETLVARIEGSIRNALRNGPLRKRDLENACHKHRFGTEYWNKTLNGMLHGGELEVEWKMGRNHQNSPIYGLVAEQVAPPLATDFDENL